MVCPRFFKGGLLGTSLRSFFATAVEGWITGVLVYFLVYFLYEWWRCLLKKWHRGKGVSVMLSLQYFYDIIIGFAVRQCIIHAPLYSDLHWIYSNTAIPGSSLYFITRNKTISHLPFLKALLLIPPSFAKPSFTLRIATPRQCSTHKYIYLYINIAAVFAIRQRCYYICMY